MDPAASDRVAAQRRANVRLALILAAIAAAFGIGFVVKMSGGLG